MKELVKLFFKMNKGGFVLLAIVFFVTLVSAVICDVIGVEYVTALFTAQCAGLLSILLVSSLFKVCNMKIPMGLEWGILGMVLGIILSMIIY